MGVQNDIAVLLQDVAKTEMKWRKYRESGGTVSAAGRQQVLARWRGSWRRIITNYPDVDTQLDDMVGSLLWVGNMTDYKPDEFAGNLRRALSNTIAQGRSVGVIKMDTKKSAVLASQIESRVNAWRHRRPNAGDAIKALDGFIRDAGIIAAEDAAQLLKQAVTDTERIGTVKSYSQSWDGVIESVDAAVKALRGETTKAKFGNPNLNEAGKRIIWAATLFEGGEPDTWPQVPKWLTDAVSFVTKATADLQGTAHPTILRSEVLPRIRKAMLLYENAAENPQSSQTAARELRKARHAISNITVALSQKSASTKRQFMEDTHDQDDLSKSTFVAWQLIHINKFLDRGVTPETVRKSQKILVGMATVVPDAFRTRYLNDWMHRLTLIGEMPPSRARDTAVQILLTSIGRVSRPLRMEGRWPAGIDG